MQRYQRLARPLRTWTELLSNSCARAYVLAHALPEVKHDLAADHLLAACWAEACRGALGEHIRGGVGDAVAGAAPVAIPVRLAGLALVEVVVLDSVVERQAYFTAQVIVASVIAIDLHRHS